MTHPKRRAVDLSRLSIRQPGHGKIRYDLKSVLRTRAKHKQQQRRAVTLGSYVVGRFVPWRGLVVLEAVQMQVGYWIDDRAPLTRELKKMARWRTRQGARKWKLAHPRLGLSVVNFKRRHFVDPDDLVDGAPGRLSKSKRGRCSKTTPRKSHPSRA